MCDRRWAAAALLLLVSVTGRVSAQQGTPQNSSQDGLQAKSPEPSVVVTGLDSDGLEVISPESPDFDVRARKLFSVQAANVILMLKPLLLILSNHTERTLVAFAFIWKITYSNKRTDTTMAEYKYPDAIAGTPDIGNVPLEQRDDRPLAGGQQKLVASEVELGPGVGRTLLPRSASIVCRRRETRLG